MTTIHPPDSVRIALLQASDAPALGELLDTNPRGTLYLRSLVHEHGAAPTDRADHGRFIGAFRDRKLAAVLFQGNSRNLCSEGDPALLERLVREGLTGTAPRLFVGPAEHADMIRLGFNRFGTSPFLDRNQTYYVLTPETLAEIEPIEVSHARPEWIEPITRAHAAMTEEDLCIPRHALDLGRLREIAAGRIRAGKVWVVMDGEHLLCKVEDSGRTPDGVLVGGVYTEPEMRGRGYATRCLATWARMLFASGVEFLALHVNSVNHPAVRAYENVGFRRHRMLRMLLSF